MHFARKILKILFDFLCPFVAHDRETAVLRLFGKWKQKKTDSRSVVPFGKGIPQGIPPPANGKVIDTNHPWLGFPVGYLLNVANTPCAQERGKGSYPTKK